MFKRFLKDTSGNFAITFAVSSTALLIGAGVAVDTAGIYKQKNYQQNLTDASLLAAVSTFETEKNKLKKLTATRVDESNELDSDIKTELNIVDDMIVATTTSTYNYFLMGILGNKDVSVQTISKVPVPKQTPMNIALVLDRTGSMAGANLTSLQTASKAMIDIFETFESEINVSVIPFSNYVNVGMSNRNASWLDVPADSSITHPPGACYDRDVTDRSQCTSTQYTDTCTNDGVTSSCTKTNWNCPSSATTTENYCPGEWTENITWNGCVGSRDFNNHKVPDYKGKRIPGIMNETCGEELLPLTDNLNSVESKIDSLTASGNTYIPSGLIWGWRSLDADQPLNDLSNSEQKRKKALVLMTDGANTLSLNQPLHDGSDTDAANKLSKELCALIKAEGIDIYTVAYNFAAGTDDTKKVVKECASSNSQFFDATDPASLKSAFEDIAHSLFLVRLAG